MTSNVGEMLQKLSERIVKTDKKKATTGPWVVKFPKFREPRQDWAVATDFRAIVWAVNWRPTLIQELPCDDNISEVRRRLLPYFDTPKEAELIAETPLTMLREFAGESKWEESCPVCKSLSKDNSYVSCSFCENDGNVWPDMRYGFIGGVPVDLQRLACVLEPFPQANVLVQKSDPLFKTNRKEEKCLWFVADDFRVALIGICPSATTDESQEDYELWKAAPRLFDPK